MKHRRRTPAIHGFTLIELLVVVAIIALLIAILMPSLSRARNQAKSLVCSSQLRQLGMAWTMYTLDSNGVLFNYYLQMDAPRHDWAGMLSKYYNDNTKLLICPMTDDPPGQEGVGNIGVAGVRMGSARLAWAEYRYYPDDEPYRHGSYAYNNNLNPDSTYGRLEDRYQSTSDIDQPSRTPVIGDCVWRQAIAGLPGTLRIFPPDLDNPETSMPSNVDAAFRFVTNRHDAATNFTFADGHTEAISLSRVWSLKWHKNYDTAAPVIGAP